MFRQFAGVCRLIYNVALDQRTNWWRQYRANTGSHISYVSQARELTMMRREFDWIAAVPQVCQQQALRDLDKAFSAFFAGRARYPSPRRRSENDSFRYLGREVCVRKLSAKWSEVRVPKIGWVKFRDTRPIRGTIKNVTVAFAASGWHISFASEIEIAAPEGRPEAVGLDRGVANTISLSTGERFSLPASLRALERKRRAAQRILSRRKRGSNRRARALKRCSQLSARAANVRRDWHHKAALALAQRFGLVVIEKLNVRSMTAASRGPRNRAKSGLNRAILDQGWSAFETILSYKLEEFGGDLSKVDAAYTSQTCSSCGAVDRESRESQARFVCRHCGFLAHADHNAAINILRRNTASMRVEDERWLTDEARTRRAYRPENRPAKAA